MDVVTGEQWADLPTRVCVIPMALHQWLICQTFLQQQRFAVVCPGVSLMIRKDRYENHSCICSLLYILPD